MAYVFAFWFPPRGHDGGMPTSAKRQSACTRTCLCASSTEARLGPIRVPGRSSSRSDVPVARRKATSHAQSHHLQPPAGLPSRPTKRTFWWCWCSCRCVLDPFAYHYRLEQPRPLPGQHGSPSMHFTVRKRSGSTSTSNKSIDISCFGPPFFCSRSALLMRLAAALKLAITACVNRRRLCLVIFY